MPISLDDIAAVSNEAIPIQLSRRIEPEVASLMAEYGAIEMGLVGASASFNMFDPAVVGFITDFSAMKAVGITRTTRRQIARELAHGIAAGEGIEPMARRLRDKFRQMQLGRARVIARTEVNHAANAARTIAHRQSGMVSQRRWLATVDARVRDTHIALHGQVRDIDKPFEVRGRRAMYPGGFGVAREDINCRCTTIPIVRRASRVRGPFTPGASGARRVRANAADLDERELQEQFDAFVDAWTERLRVAVLRGLVAQEEAVLGGLRRADQAPA